MRVFAVASVLACVAATSAQGGESEAYWYDLRGAHQKPTRVFFTSGASFNPRFTKLGPWKNWGATRTSTRGVYRYKTCKPDCINSDYRRVRVKVRLSGLRVSCEGRRVYKRFTWKARNPRIDDGTVAVDCDGVIAY